MKYCGLRLIGFYLSLLFDFEITAPTVILSVQSPIRSTSISLGAKSVASGGKATDRDITAGNHDIQQSKASVTHINSKLYT